MPQPAWYGSIATRGPITHPSWSTHSGAVIRPPRALIVEDHPLYRRAVRAVLGAAGVDVVGEAGSVEGVPADLWSARPVVVLDLGLPGRRGTDAVAYLAGMGLPVLVLTAHPGPAMSRAVQAAGARGYLTKDADGAEIVRAVRTVAAGRTCFDPVPVPPGTQRTLGAAEPALSPREHQVLVLLASGARDYDIGRRLDISIRTVRSHLDRIRDKTGRRRRSDLTRFAIEQGFIGFVPSDGAAAWDAGADAAPRSPDTRDSTPAVWEVAHDDAGPTRHTRPSARSGRPPEMVADRVC